MSRRLDRALVVGELPLEDLEPLRARGIDRPALIELGAGQMGRDAPLEPGDLVVAVQPPRAREAGVFESRYGTWLLSDRAKNLPRRRSTIRSTPG